MTLAEQLIEVARKLETTGEVSSPMVLRDAARVLTECERQFGYIQRGSGPTIAPIELLRLIRTGER